MKKDILRARLAEEEKLKAIEDSKKIDDDDDRPESRNSLETTSPKKKDMNKERK